VLGVRRAIALAEDDAPLPGDEHGTVEASVIGRSANGGVDAGGGLVVGENGWP
jgi:hypothetical protein